MWTPSERLPDPAPLRLTGGHVLDPRTGTVRRADVVVAGGVVRDVCPPGTRPVDGTDEAVVVDLDGRHLLPGLVSVHTHLSAVYPFADHDPHEDGATSALRALSRATDALHAGVTTVRCLDETNRADIALRAAADAGWVRTPRILAAGKAVSTTGGHGHGFGCSFADGYDGFLKAGRTEFAAGADHLKIFITGGIAREGEDFVGAEMTADELAGAVRSATERGKYVVAHAGHGPAIREAIAAGVRSFEHAYDVDEQTAHLMAAAGVFCSPTLSVTHCPAWMADHHFTPWQIERATSVAPRHMASIRRLVEHGRPTEGPTGERPGITFTTGTDYPPGEPYEDTSCQVREMELMAAAGLSAGEVLRAATWDGARLVRHEHVIGAIEPGYAADIIVVDDDPSTDLAALRGLRLVVAAGHVVRDDLSRRQRTPGRLAVSHLMWCRARSRLRRGPGMSHFWARLANERDVTQAAGAGSLTHRRIRAGTPRCESTNDAGGHIHHEFGAARRAADIFGDFSFRTATFRDELVTVSSMPRRDRSHRRHRRHVRCLRHPVRSPPSPDRTP